MKLFRVSCCLLVLLLSLLAFTFVPWSQAGPAHATSPGQNGRIAYRVLDPSTGNWILHTANPDGSHVQQLTSLPGFFQEWSPGGTRIAFDFFEANGFEQIATAAPDGSGLQVLTSGPFSHEVPSWSPDETEIVFDYTATDPNLPGWPGTRLRVMNADGTNAHPLMAPALAGFDVEPRWQPTGGLITFARIRKGSRGIQQEAVYVVNADGTNPRQLTSWGLAPEHPTWSPDGQWILFNDAASKPGLEETIYTMHPDGTDRHVVYQGTAHTGGVKPQFSPDGTKILFSCVTYGQAFNEDLCVMNADGSGVVDITNTPGVLENFPSWGTAPLE